MDLRPEVAGAAFSVREISEKAGQQEDAVRFDIGQPDFRTPEVVRHTVAQQLQEEHITYTSLWGRQDLREEIAAYESGKAGLGPEHVMVTTGGIGGLHCIMTGLLGSGQSVLMNDPAWMPYSLIANVSPGTFDQVSFFDGDGGVRRDAIREAVTDDTELLLLNTPENPTGRVYTREQVQALGAIAAEHDLWMVADEVYDHLLYGDATHVSPLELFPDRTITVKSLSKNFAMTGWRLGWIAARNEGLIRELGKVNRAATACPNFPAQLAGLVALQEAQDYVEEMRAAFEQRRDLTMKRINELGWDAVTPAGSIYAFPDVGTDSWTFAEELLAEAGVGVVPGAAAGSASDTNVRICFGSVDLDRIAEGFDRIEAFVG
ncbi:MAG: pyridoxal phosphate-dependent aminotransferase [Candidatus Nanohaloarchaea archaeon]|nr:pyridoxal phosphate-dependent aminotransferase [Candidatus Nanohaloarchaea archaeon]